LLSSSAQVEEGEMTGCIVGWAHTKFGKHDGRDLESLIVEVRRARSPMPASPPPISIQSISAR
jgi:hypothetical protein